MTVLCHKCATPLPDGSRFCLSCGVDVSGDPASPTASLTGDQVDQLLKLLREDVGPEFTVVREIGRGGMAAVFLATELTLARKVAIKVLPPELTFSPGLVDRFVREARTAAALDHPHIVPIHRVSSSGKLFWYAMKFIEGTDLAAVIRSTGPMSVVQVLKYLVPVAEALDYAHQRDVVHRDVKPANVMLDERDWVYVTDFGIAKAMGSASLTGSGGVIGTPLYMSPEQCEGKPVSPAADQYSLAVMAYQMFTGHVPFEGNSAIEILAKHCTTAPAPLEELRPAVGHAVSEVVHRGLAKQAEDRFPNTVAFVEALRVASQRGAVGAKVAGKLSAGGSRPKRDFALRTSPPPGSSGGATGRMAERVLTIVVLAAAAGGGYWFVLRPGLRTTALPAAGAASPPAPASALDAPAAGPAVEQRPSRPESAAARPQLPASSLALVRFSVVPANAPGLHITLNGKPVEGRRASVPLGPATVMIAAEGYRPYSADFTVRTLSPPYEVRADLVPLSPSDPGVRVLPVPAAPSAVAPTNLSGRRSPERTAAAGLRAVRDSATLTIQALPWADVYLDGVRIGPTPRSNVRVPAGSHQIRLVRAGYLTREVPVVLRPGESKTQVDTLAKDSVP